MEPVDMVTLCADVAELYEPLAEAKQLTLTATPAARHRSRAIAICCSSDRQPDRHAIKYSVPDGAVSLSVATDGAFVEVVVADRGRASPKKIASACCSGSSGSSRAARRRATASG